MTMDSIPLTIAGNLGADPELTFTPSGAPVAKLLVAVNNRYQDARGTWIDGTTSWYTVIAWRGMGENATESLHSGDRVIVHGRHQQRSYETDNGEKRYVWELIADEIGTSLAFATATPVKTNRPSETSS